MISFLRFATSLFSLNALFAAFIEWRVPGFVSSEIPFFLVVLLPIVFGFVLLVFSEPSQTVKKGV
ncbi:hypothetical protein KBC55_02950 [Patescibacteria group bacterium]|nr:hypothetical protein [Patescibacteria group bacterium]